MTSLHDSRRWGVAVSLVLIGISVASSVSAQVLPLAPPRDAGQTVTPAFEGWYKNPDGSFTLSFGYFNRNEREVLEIPVGPHNFLSPGAQNQGQPTRFHARRHWGVFGVRVPADFDPNASITWTLVAGRDTFAIPAGLRRGWEIDALQGEAGSGNTPPILKFAADGQTGSGPAGSYGPDMMASIGAPLTLNVWATDDGRASGSVASTGRSGVGVTLTWFVHQAPAGAEVTFADATPAVNRDSGLASTTATFSHAGNYILRVRANDASGVAGAGHAQCCWSNGFIRVTVR